MRLFCQITQCVHVVTFVKIGAYEHLNTKRGEGGGNLEPEFMLSTRFVWFCHTLLSGVNQKRAPANPFVKTNHCAGMGITIRCEDHCLAIIRHVHLEALEVKNHLELCALLYQASLLDWDFRL